MVYILELSLYTDVDISMKERKQHFWAKYVFIL